MRFRLLTLLSVATVCAVLFALVPRDARLIGELRRDLHFSREHRVTIVDRVGPDCVLAVAEQGKVFKLFVCYRDFWGSSDNDAWEIPFVVGSGAPPGEPEPVIEYPQEFSHFPTSVEVSSFRKDYGL